MPLLLVDALDPAEAVALRSHLAGGCPKCAAYLAEADAVLAHLPFALDLRTPRDAARGRLFERIGVEEPRREELPGRAPGGRARVLRFPAWARGRAFPAAVAAALTFVATAWFMLDVLQKQQRDYFLALANSRQQVQALEEQQRSATQIYEVFYGSRKLVLLEGRAQPKAFARAWWDARRQAWHVKAFNLDPLPAKDAYELWFITPYGRKVGVLHTFKPDEHGGAYLVAPLPADVGPIAALAITDEPEVGTFQPTGTVHLYGKLD